MMNLNNPYSILARLGLTEAEIQVYLTMNSGAETVREIIQTTGQKRPTVYYVLGRLTELGLASKVERGRGVAYKVESPRALEVLAQQQLDTSRATKLAVVDLIPVLQKKTKRQSDKPHVAFFQGRQAVQNVIQESLYCKSKVIHSLAPHSNYFWHVGKSFVEKYVQERFERKIKTFNLWEEPIDPKIYRSYYQNISQVRILPSSMKEKFSTTIFLYDDTALFISSLENNYCLLVRSEEFYATHKALFEGLWAISRPHPKS